MRLTSDRCENFRIPRGFENLFGRLERLKGFPAA
jgi:hypothetical protein